MDKNEVVSPFQIDDWRILRFDSSNVILTIPPDIIHNWVIKAHMDKLEDSDDYMRALLSIDFQFFAEDGGQKMTMEGVCVLSCRMKKGVVEEEMKVFEGLLSRTAMTNCLANLRVFLLQSGILLRMGSKCTMLPFVNLNSFEYDKEIRLMS